MTFREQWPFHCAVAVLSLVGTLANAAEVRGRLDAKAADFSGYRYRIHRFSSDGSAPVAIGLRSSNFDAYLVLIAPDKQIKTNDDQVFPPALAGGKRGRGDAAVAVEHPAAGEWIAIATSYQARQIGEYTLRYSGVTTLPTVTDPSPTDEQLVSRAFRSRGIEDPLSQLPAVVDQLTLSSFRGALRTAISDQIGVLQERERKIREDRAVLDARKETLARAATSLHGPQDAEKVVGDLITAERERIEKQVNSQADSLVEAIRLRSALGAAASDLEALGAVAEKREQTEEALLAGPSASDDALRQQLVTLREQQRSAATVLAEKLLKSGMLQRLKLSGFQTGTTGVRELLRISDLAGAAEIAAFDAEAYAHKSMYSQALALSPMLMGSTYARAFSSGDGGMTPRYESVDTSVWLPALLPWPPPDPSSRVVLLRGLLEHAPGGITTLGDVDVAITSALGVAGYFGSSYWGVPGGFAVVTPLEQTDDRGKPLDGAARWIDAPVSMKAFSLAEYFRALLTAPPGYFRVLMFVVSDAPFAPSGAVAKLETVERWSRGGLNVLPQSLQRQVLTDQHNVTVQVYEFVKAHDDDEPETTVPGHLAAVDHLRAAKLTSLVAQ
jgi:hypothetical protein